MKKHLFFLFTLMCLIILPTSCSDDDDKEDMVSLYVKIAVRVDSRAPRSITLFGGNIYLGEGHEENWLITQEYYRLYGDWIKVKREDVVQLTNAPFKSNSTYAKSFLHIDYPWAPGKVFDITPEMKGHEILLIMK